MAGRADQHRHGCTADPDAPAWGSTAPPLLLRVHRPVALTDFQQGLVNIRPSTSAETINMYGAWAREHGTAA